MHRHRVMNGCPRILNRRSHKFDFIGSLTASFQERVLDQETWIILEFRNILGNLSWAEKVWWSQSDLLNPAIKFPSNASLIQNEIWISFEVRIKLILPRFSALPKSRLSGLQKEMDNDENTDSRSMPLEPFCWNSGSRIIVRQAQCSEKWQRVEKEVGNDENNQSRSASLMVENYTSKSNWPKKVTTAPKSGRELLERSW